MYQVYLDVEFTRRKTMFHVQDDQGDIVFSGPTMSSAIEYLHDMGQTEFRMKGTPNVADYVAKLATV